MQGQAATGAVNALVDLRRWACGQEQVQGQAATEGDGQEEVQGQAVDALVDLRRLGCGEERVQGQAATGALRKRWSVYCCFVVVCWCCKSEERVPGQVANGVVRKRAAKANYK